jgi:putative flippase GtrA
VARSGTGLAVPAGLMLRHAARFAVVGALNTGVYYGSYLLLRTVVHYLAAHLIAIVVAMVGSFFLNCYWTFRTPPTWRKFMLWPLTNATNYVLTTIGVVVLVEWLTVDQRVAPLIAAAAAIPVTFLLSRRVLTGGVARVPPAHDASRLPEAPGVTGER